MTLTPITISLYLYGAFVLALTTAEYRADSRAQWFLKPACALGFIIIALQSGALETFYGQVILAALCLCAVGDAALLSRKSQKLFLLGMTAFALGHFAYAFAFFGPYMSRIGTYTGLGLAALLVGVFKIFIWNNIPRDMRLPVSIYIIIIGLMLVLAVDYAFAAQIWVVGIAAIMFAVSDFFVGKDRFVERKSWHALVITPLYFGAQALFALSAAHTL